MTAWILVALITAGLLFFIVVFEKLWAERLAHRRITRVVDLGKGSSVRPVRLEVELNPARKTARYHRLLMR